ncbi:uncharacterized protein LOC108462567 [Gossypium arboreum]|uniref:uncharacterized protein LOC108462567 n=1 Tax=Gossypium arboreum TaxID=29729 RepID=UPI0022F14876|nr:uncharacterized protein LOC108462567 [Gossypium arboreum]
MQESNNYGHQHPLLLVLNQEQLIHSQSGVTDCSRCGEKVSAPCFCCAEHCGFYLHKVCAGAPLELNHPFHPHHPLLLMQNAPYTSAGEYACDFCDKDDNKFVYHCSCGLDFHIKCALFTFNIAENNLKELEHVALQYPLISTENGDEELEDVAKCFGCWEPLAKYTRFSPDCGFNLHEKCAKLPFKLNHMLHREHPLVLQFNSQRLSCKICLETSECTSRTCLRCVIALTPGARTCLKHEHPLRFYRRYEGKCNACSHFSWGAFCCKDCNFVLDLECFSLPIMAQHKCDKHLLSLIDRDDNDDNSYSENHYCDICEES